MNLSVNPSFKCNFRCDFCYLSPSQLLDSKRSNLQDLSALLSKINSYKRIESIDLYGGEIGILPISYLLELKSLLREYVSSINVITNLKILNPIFYHNDISISVSYDFDYRQDHLEVLSNIQKLDKPVSILTLAIPEIIEKNPQEMIEILNSLKNISAWEIKKYSKNQSNQKSVSYIQYERFLLKVLSLKNEMRFTFVNENQIKACLSGSYSSWSDSHLYITPNAKIGVLSFDSNDNEFFEEFDSLDQYEQWSKREKESSQSNPFCSTCKYQGSCYTEHLRVPKKDPANFSCDGQYLLLSNSF